MVELKKPIQFGKTKQEIKLHNFDDVFPDNTVTFVSGWGNTKNNSESRDKLRGAEVPLVNQKKCQEAYDSHKITPRMVCAGFEQGGKDSCQVRHMLTELDLSRCFNLFLIFFFKNRVIQAVH